MWLPPACTAAMHTPISISSAACTSACAGVCCVLERCPKLTSLQLCNCVGPLTDRLGATCAARRGRALRLHQLHISWGASELSDEGLAALLHTDVVWLQSLVSPDAQLMGKLNCEDAVLCALQTFKSLILLPSAAGAERVQPAYRCRVASHCAAQQQLAVPGSRVLWHSSSGGQVSSTATCTHDCRCSSGGFGIMPCAARFHSALLHCSLDRSRGGAAACWVHCVAEPLPGGVALHMSTWDCTVDNLHMCQRRLDGAALRLPQLIHC